MALFSISLGAQVSHYLFINHLNCQYNKQCKMMIVRMMDVLPSSEVCWSLLTACFCQSGCTDNPVYYSPLKRKQFYVCKKYLSTENSPQKESVIKIIPSTMM